jgi:putative endonuclease
VPYKQFYVYMMSNRWLNVLFPGVTNSLNARVWQHKNGAAPGFTKKYNCDRLVYFEMYDEVKVAIEREKQLKRWSRSKKNRLIEMSNPDWLDLASDWYADVSSRPSEASGGTPFLRSDGRADAGDPSTPLGMTPKHESEGNS